MIGMTRREEQGQAIEKLGAKAVITDVFDREQIVKIIRGYRQQSADFVR
ncbi:hypothetical protein YSY22_01120 [Brevibacillus formosus]